MSAQATYGGVATVVASHTDYSGTVTSWTYAGAKVLIKVATPIGLTTITTLTITTGS